MHLKEMDVRATIHCSFSAFGEGFFGTGTMMVVFHSRGIYPVSKDDWKILTKTEARELWHCLRTVPGMWSGLHALREFVFLKQFSHLFCYYFNMQRVNSVGDNTHR